MNSYNIKLKWIIVSESNNSNRRKISHALISYKDKTTKSSKYTLTKTDNKPIKFSKNNIINKTKHSNKLIIIEKLLFVILSRIFLSRNLGLKHKFKANLSILLQFFKNIFQNRMPLAWTIFINLKRSNSKDINNLHIMGKLSIIKDTEKESCFMTAAEFIKDFGR